MASKELKAAYNASNTRQAIARAIRAEIEDGEEILDAESQATGRVAREGLFVPRTGEPTLAACQLSNARNRRDESEAIIRERWGMPPAVGQSNHR
jgi:aspartate/tyrosine/aromatic aminotransferase